jgi:hypothetical protein
MASLTMLSGLILLSPTTTLALASSHISLSRFNDQIHFEALFLPHTLYSHKVQLPKFLVFQALKLQYTHYLPSIKDYHLFMYHNCYLLLEKSSSIDCLNCLCSKLS